MLSWFLHHTFPSIDSEQLVTYKEHLSSTELPLSEFLRSKAWPEMVSNDYYFGQSKVLAKIASS